MKILEEKNILVVDDELDILESVAEVLSSSNVTPASNFEEAQGLIAPGAFDLAILDIMGVNGFELLKLCVKSNIPATMLTAHAINVESLNKSVKLGAISFLPKEELFRLPELVSEIFEDLAKARAHWQKLFERLDPFFKKKLGISWEEAKSQFPVHYY